VFKICHIITDLDVGGAEFMLKRLVEEQSAQRDFMSIVSLTNLGKIGEQLQAQGFTVYTLNMAGKLGLLIAFWRLCKLLKELRPDVVQTWMYHADLLGGLAAYFCGIRRIVWGIHCSKLPIGRPLTKVVMLICAKMSSWLPAKIICVAEAAKANHIEYGYAKHKMTIIPNGFSEAPIVKDFTKSRHILKKYDVADSAFIVGCVGRFHPDKGQDILIEAVSLVAEKAANTQFVLVGRGCDKENSHLINLIDNFNLRSKIILLGERDDIPLLLPEFDLFCMPSRTEAFPVALGEAMLAGLPCVATDVGDAKELGGPTTWFVEPCDVNSLAIGIMAMSEKPAPELAERGLQGRLHVKELYSIQNVSRLYSRVYQDLFAE